MAQWVIERRARPARSEVLRSSGGWLATFTLHAQTVTIEGPERTFEETAVGPTVTHRIWVRTLPAPFDGRVDASWLERALRANARRHPDILALCMQYVSAAPPVRQGDLQIAGDASYGPLRADGTREEGSDFNDYLGIPWTYPDGTLDPPEKRQFRCLDCSGFMRMVWGWRPCMPRERSGSIALGLEAQQPPRRALPRRAVDMAAAGPGIAIVPNTGTQVTDFKRLAVGDLVFFDASDDDGTDIDHVGLYLGLDDSGRHRFVSSRKGADGPTLGDVKGASLLDGTGTFAKAFRAVRRL